MKQTVYNSYSRNVSESKVYTMFKTIQNNISHNSSINKHDCSNIANQTVNKSLLKEDSTAIQKSSSHNQMFVTKFGKKDKDLSNLDDTMSTSKSTAFKNITKFPFRATRNFDPNSLNMNKTTSTSVYDSTNKFALSNMTAGNSLAKTKTMTIKNGLKNKISVNNQRQNLNLNSKVKTNNEKALDSNIKLVDDALIELNKISKSKDNSSKIVVFYNKLLKSLSDKSNYKKIIKPLLSYLQESQKEVEQLKASLENLRHNNTLTNNFSNKNSRLVNHSISYNYSDCTTAFKGISKNKFLTKNENKDFNNPINKPENNKDINRSKNASNSAKTNYAFENSVLSLNLKDKDNNKEVVQNTKIHYMSPVNKYCSNCLPNKDDSKNNYTGSSIKDNKDLVNNSNRKEIIFPITKVADTENESASNQETNESILKNSFNSTAKKLFSSAITYKSSINNIPSLKSNLNKNKLKVAGQFPNKTKKQLLPNNTKHSNQVISKDGDIESLKTKVKVLEEFLNSHNQTIKDNQRDNNIVNVVFYNTPGCSNANSNQTKNVGNNFNSLNNQLNFSDNNVKDLSKRKHPIISSDFSSPIYNNKETEKEHTKNNLSEVSFNCINAKEEKVDTEYSKLGK